MPKYTFKCVKCGASKQSFTLKSCKVIRCECGDSMDRQMPQLRSIKSTETVDKFHNKKLVQDQDIIIKERKSDYYWDQVVPDLVKSGTYTLDTMLEQNWVFYNEKGNLVTRTKPPEKS